MGTTENVTAREKPIAYVSGTPPAVGCAPQSKISKRLLVVCEVALKAVTCFPGISTPCAMQSAYDGLIVVGGRAYL